MTGGWMRWLAVLALVAGPALAPGAHAQSRAVGAVSELQGDATAARSGARPRALAASSDVFFRDTLRTGAGARLATSFADGTRLTLGENASVVVDAFVYDPDKSIGRLTARIAGGAFLFVGGRIEEQSRSNVQIRTPLATLGVRGTTVWGGPIDGAYGIFVQNGEVVVRTRRGNVTLRAGEGTTLRPRRGPEPVVVWGADKVRRALASVTISR